MIRFTLEEALCVIGAVHGKPHMAKDSAGAHLHNCMLDAYAHYETHSAVPLGVMPDENTLEAMHNDEEAGDLLRRLAVYHAYRVAFPNKPTQLAIRVAGLLHDGDTAV